MIKKSFFLLSVDKTFKNTLPHIVTQ